MSKKALKEISNLINEKARIGMILVLGNTKMKCIDTEEDSYGTRFVFDNGKSWTKSNIESNIVLAIQKGNVFGIA
jgi:hypothetical protein